ncbi:FprA family A-type flavoprotein [Clostridium botulinum]|uniref:FprA family A-type flavoprotein n=1 Tax=Clostridium botulinum TaxID=1491 RepID=UPI001C9ADBBC|nr:FprA family A-type flavoprotein [Clostridium botulinum]MBY6809143.1 FprA family A-type flavoprotein [Clostridium botulinum]MBY6822152.1 FprA family A-type flavoprotein [Clostridium botulinum]MBY6833058.1 FprA family A-type flavoprotein [Clostridium botulinum]MBY6972286.1 FprA family A-type flavoprotein [Clostridium botulinum]MCS6104660.1 FprA family A-type flavoprotein [Clostridium botulinum]
MFCVRKVTEDLYWIGGNDKRLALFENIHPIPRGVSYNSYLLLDEKTVLFDTVDWSISRQFIENIQHVLNGRTLDYLVINHMEPDHGASIEEILLRYPNVKIISTEKAFLLMRQFGFNIDGKEEVVKEGDTKSFGKHVVTFIAAPMVHWPEAMVTFDTTNGVLFSADAFGSFGALDGKLFNDEIDFEHEWLDDARRYYTNIVGKYGPHVQSLLKKASGIDIKMICPLHGPVWRTNIGYFIDKYDKWSKYEPEEKAVMIVYASMYGNTENAANVLATKFVEKGIKNIVMYDVSSTHVSKLISETFRVSHVVLASVTYNLGIYPPMHNYLMDMKALNLQNRTFAIIENGSWACKSGKLIREFLDGMKNSTILDEKVTLVSSMKEDNVADMDELVKVLWNQWISCIK